MSAQLTAAVMLCRAQEDFYRHTSGCLAEVRANQPIPTIASARKATNALRSAQRASDAITEWRERLAGEIAARFADIRRGNPR